MIFIRLDIPVRWGNMCISYTGKWIHLNNKIKSKIKSFILVLIH